MPGPEQRSAEVPVVDLSQQYGELKAELDAAIARVIASSAYIGGADVAGFERELAAYLGVRHVVGVANGTDALELALQAVGIGGGDSVLTVPFTFAGTLEAIVRVGATPVLADISPDDFTLDADAAARVFATQPIKAVIPVHLYGHPADLDRLLPLAERHGAAVIEDAAQAHGAWCTVAGERRRVGSVGHLACFSFYPTKNLGAMGDAGAVATDRADLAERVRLLARHGECGKYRHVVANGRNSRLDGIQAAVLRVKLAHLDRWNTARRRVAARYRQRLAGLPLRLPEERAGVESVYHQYVIRVADRDAVRDALARLGIGTAVHYPLALHQQEGFAQLGYPRGAFPVAEGCAAEVLSLPMFPQMNEADVDYVSGCVGEVVQERRREKES